jgi:prepilin-type N-terminal cleavage/methylation domain-containing protein/prepilin-type processing-associated H-X9-DG protein
MSKKAFTLIEILMVIALISLLAAMLFPVFAQARKSARSITCVSNMRQLGVAISMYAGDYDDSYPNGTDDGRKISCNKGFYPEGIDKINPSKSIYDLLTPYTSNNSQIWKCPQDSGVSRGGPCFDIDGNDVPSTPTENMSLFKGRGNSYFYRVELGYRGIRFPASGYDTARPRNEVSSSGVGVLLDAGPFWHGTQEFMGDRQNILFADGHVKSHVSIVTAWDWPLTENESLED